MSTRLGAAASAPSAKKRANSAQAQAERTRGQRGEAGIAVNDAIPAPLRQLAPPDFRARGTSGAKDAQPSPRSVHAKLSAASGSHAVGVRAVRYAFRGCIHQLQANDLHRPRRPVASSPALRFQARPVPPLREARILGIALRYYDVGSGPPLVLVHGVGGDADQWCFCLAAFSARYRVVAIDLPGFGRSDKPAIDYRIATFVDALAALVQALELPPAHLLGHSLGGWIVASYALARPRDVRSLILNDAVGLDEGASPLPVDLHLTTRENLRKAFEAMFFDQSKVSDALVDLAYGLHRSRGDGPTIDSVLRTLAAPDEKLDEHLASIRVPTLLLWGEDDRIAPLSMAEAFRRGLPDARLGSIPRCGHLPCIEQPQAFAESVLRFLEGLQNR